MFYIREHSFIVMVGGGGLKRNITDHKGLGGMDKIIGPPKELALLNSIPDFELNEGEKPKFCMKCVRPVFFSNPAP